MSEEQFSEQAAVLWGTISRESREKILKSVWCVKCQVSVEMVRFTGKEQQGDLILRGSCAQCGHEVARVVETGERDLSGN